MKSYEEMSNTVLEKIRIRKNAQIRRNNRIIMCITGMFCLALTVTVVSRSLRPNRSEIQIQNPTSASPSEPTKAQIIEDGPRIMLLCASSSDRAPEVLQENVRIPIMAQLRVRNVSGMTKEEREQVLNEENAYVEEIEKKFGQDSGYGRYCRDNVIVTRISAGLLSIGFEDIETVEQVKVSVTENGYIFYPRISGITFTDYDENGLTVTVDGDSLRKGLGMLDTDKFEMVWHFNPSVAERLNEDPDMDLALLSDRVTISVTHTDGSVETKTVVIQVCDDGQISIVLVDGTLVDQIPK